MKRVFTFLCALVLLLTSFSGMVVSAAEVDTAPVTEIVAEEPAAEAPAQEEAPEAPAEEAPAEQEPVLLETEMEAPELTPDLRKDASAPVALAAALEHEVSASFMTYLKQQFAACTYEFNVEKYNFPYSQWRDLTSVIWYETPELFHVYTLGCSYYSGGKVVSIRVGYRPHCNTAAQYKACLSKMVTNADYLLRGLKGNTALDNVEKALILHDRLAAWVEYDLENVELDDGTHKIYAAYSALGEGLSVCQGYALAYMYLLEQVGIESDLCSSNALDHAWNIVYIDGVPYHVDVTWDDPTNGRYDEFFDNLGRVWHKNFLLSNDGIWNTGHRAYDYNTEPYDTRYDYSGWWRESETAIQLVNSNRLFYRDKDDGHVYQYDDGYTWVAAYTDGYNGSLSANGTNLLFNSRKEVFVYDTTIGSQSPLFAPSSIWYTNGYIEGMKYEKGKIHVQINDGSGYSWRESTDYAEQGTPLTIVTQPKNAVAANGGTAKITVKAQGDGLTYTWYHKSAGAASYKQSSVTGATYAVKVSSSVHGRYVYCVVSDMYGNTVQTNVVRVYMGNVAKLTAQPQNAVAPNGKTAKITVKASGDGLTYTWYHKSAGAASYKKSCVTGATYAVKVSSAVHGRYVYCVVKDKYGNTVKTSVVRVYMGTPAKITAQPKSVSVFSGKTGKITIKASGSGLTYTWYAKNKGAASYSKSSVKTNTYAFKMSSALNGRQVYCVVKDKYGVTIKSAVVTIKLAQKVKITAQPTSATAQSGKVVKVTVKATGDGLKYQWYYAKKGSSTYKKISGATTATYSAKMSSSVNGRKVYCLVTDKYGNKVKSSVVTLRQFSSISTVAATWKGVHQTISGGNKTSISNITFKITTKKKVTLTAKGSGTGYNSGTYKYTLKYVKISGDVATYKFTNSVETLTVYYTLSKDLITISLGSGIKQVYKRA